MSERRADRARGGVPLIVALAAALALIDDRRHARARGALRVPQPGGPRGTRDGGRGHRAAGGVSRVRPVPAERRDRRPRPGHRPRRPRDQQPAVRRHPRARSRRSCARLELGSRGCRPPRRRAVRSLGLPSAAGGREPPQRAAACAGRRGRRPGPGRDRGRSRSTVGRRRSTRRSRPSRRCAPGSSATRWCW